MQTYQRTAFYFVAHADDWQLFMAPEISHDIADKKCKVVIVHFTAGDAGKEEAYWKAREFAAIHSLLFRLSVDDQLIREDDEIILNNKLLARCRVNNCHCYFLRLPDGSYYGNGFPQYGSQSLEKFRTGNQLLLTSVDGKTKYGDWADLAGTIDQLIAAELSSPIDATAVYLNVTECDTTLNPNDHNDHYNTAQVVQSTRAWGIYRKRAFVNYHIHHSNESLTNEELFWKIGMFCNYHQALFTEFGHSTILEDQSFIPWCFRKNRYRNIY